MCLTTFLLASVLLAQAPPLDTTPNVPATDIPATDIPAADIPAAETPAAASAEIEAKAAPPAMPPALYRLKPPEMVAEALVLPPGHSLQGRPLTLTDALSVATDQSQQRNIVHAYWRLVEAVAIYRFSFDYHKQLTALTTTADALPQQANEVMLLSAATASSSALLREAELAVVAAQYGLASLASLPSDALLPLPADRPHVGSYRTRFDELFATRPAPATAVLINRTLPIECLAVKGRASAVWAAEQALAASEDAYRQGSVGVAQIVSCVKERLGQRGVMIASVCRYNRDIVDYVLAVTPLGTSGKTLVPMLIKPVDDPLRPVVSAVDGQVQPAGLDEPIRETPPRETQPSKNVPTLAPRPNGEAKPIHKNVPTLAPRSNGGAKPIHKNVPTLAPRPNGEAQPIEKNVPTPAPRSDDETRKPSKAAPPLESPWRASARDEKNVPTPDPPRDEPKDTSSAEESRQPPLVQPAQPSPPPSQPIVPTRPIVPVEPEADGVEPETEPSGTEKPETRTAEKPLVEVEDASSWRASGGSHTETTTATPASRAKQLTATLHWDRKLPQSAGEPLTLAQCLQKCSPNTRAATVKVFWLTRQRAAEYQVLAQKVEMLDGLVAEGTIDQQRRLSARESAAATVHDAHVALLQAQFQLAGLIGKSTSDRAWPLPSTIPHSGSYVLNLEAQPKQLTESWSFRRLAATIPALHENILRRADAVVKAESARTSVGNSITASINAINGQTEQALAFLRVLTDYNDTIAEYALTVLPPDTSGERLAAALVLQ